MKTLDVVAAVLLVVGGLNWGLVGVFDFDLVAALFGETSAGSRAVYTLVGLAALYQAVSVKALRRRWGRGATAAGAVVGALALVAATGAPVAAQQAGDVTLDARGGVAVPTFDIADIVDAGPSFGLGAKYWVGDRVFLRAAADFGFHPGDEDAVVDGTSLGEFPDVDVFHYIGGAGVRLTPSDSRWFALVNAGAGAMTFDVDVDAEDSSFTYFAVNVGGEAGYRVTERVALFVSPQGNIAFSDEDEVFTGDAWVWPFTAGVRIRP